MRHHKETLSTVEPIYVNPNGELASPLKEKQMMLVSSTSPQLTNCWTQTNTGFIWKAQNSRTGIPMRST